ncbi:MAG: OmpA family protein [Chitinophagales bacterium]|nr:OmpA family protein [Chitinophagales bacterium]MDW8417847.1 OmpA family protein [Chitinophagales bacterium]
MRYFLLAVLTPLVMFVNAQSEEGKLKNVQKYPNYNWRKKLKIARKKMEEGSYYNAAQYLEDVYKAKPDKIEVTHRLGEVNRYLRDYEQAEKYYKATVDKDPDAYPNDWFFLGQMQKANGKYEEAKKTFDTYLKTELGKKDVSYKNLARVERDGCDTALALIANPTKIKVERAQGVINNAIQDYAPKPLRDGSVMFSSQKTDTAVNITTNQFDHYSAIFTAQRTGNSFTNKTIYPSPPNDPKTHTGNAVLSPDGNTIIFTKCDQYSNLENKMKCKLYRCKKSNGQWGDAEELKSLNVADGTTTQPAFGIDGESNEVLYFSSTRAGRGGYDIFYAKINSDGSFGPVQNAGSEINTPGDEMTPHYDVKNKVLYFSSNGHPGLGNMDVFKVKGTPGNWGPVQNMGVPVNSGAEDFYLALDEKGTRGFMVTNREGSTSPRGKTCCFDIWTVTLQRDVFLKAIYVKRGDATKTPITGVDASLYRVAGNNFEFVQNVITTSAPFVFPVKRNTSYKINGNKEGYWPSIDNLTIAEDEERDTIEMVFYLDPIIRKKIRIPNVYFAFDKSNVIEFYQKQIDSVVAVLNANPGYSVEVQGHTDSKGTDEYNDKLSARRANEVKNFLITKKKIAENRIIVKTFGERVPAVPNELPNGEDDPEGRARNRRVEFKIIPDKPDEAPEIEYYGEVVKQVKTGPGFTYGKKKK